MSKKIEKVVNSVWAAVSISEKREILFTYISAWKSKREKTLREVSVAGSDRLDSIAANILMFNEGNRVI